MDSVKTQNQVNEQEEYFSLKFLLSWKLEYEHRSIESRKLPILSPPISSVLKENPNPLFISIIGNNIDDGSVLILAEAQYDLVECFGYIGESSLSSPTQNVIGIWIRLNSGKLVEVFHNGLVREI